jgi:type II secretory pathway component HofQ
MGIAIQYDALASLALATILASAAVMTASSKRGSIAQSTPFPQSSNQQLRKYQPSAQFSA